MHDITSTTHPLLGYQFEYATAYVFQLRIFELHAEIILECSLHEPVIFSAGRDSVQDGFKSHRERASRFLYDLGRPSDLNNLLLGRARYLKKEEYAIISSNG